MPKESKLSQKTILISVGIIAIAIIVGTTIMSGNKQTTQPQTTTTTSCKIVQQTFYRNESYVDYPSSYTIIFQQSNIPIPSNQPATIAVTLHDNSKYIVTFASDVYAHHMALDTQNKINFESGVVYNTGRRDNWNTYGKSTTQSTIPFELQDQQGGMYYFIFDQTSQKTQVAPSSGTGSLTVQEAKGVVSTRQVPYTVPTQVCS